MKIYMRVLGSYYLFTRRKYNRYKKWCPKLPLPRSTLSMVNFGLRIYQLKDKWEWHLILYIDVQNKKYRNNIKSHSYFYFNY